MTGTGAIEAKLAHWAPTVLKGLAVAVGAAGPEIDPRLREVTLLAGAAVAGESAARLQADPWRAAIATAGAAAAASTGLVQASRLAREIEAAGRAANALGPLAASLTVASVTALDRVFAAAEPGGDPRRRMALLVGAAGVAGAGVALLSRGNRAYALALGWGMARLAADGIRRRRATTIVAASVGLAAIAAASWYGARGRPPTP